MSHGLWFGLYDSAKGRRSRCGPCEAGAKEYNNTHAHTKIRNPSSSVGVGGAV
jgi:hypothetical protein